MKRVFQSLMALLFAAMLPVVGSANEGALYDPVAPKGAAFVRLFNLSGGSLGGVSAAGKTFPELEGFSAGEYLFFTAYDLEVLVKGQSRVFALNADKRYTLVIGADQAVHLIEDPKPGKRTKAMLVAYNLTAAPSVDFKTADGKAPLATGIEYLNNAFREINAVKVDFGFFSGQQKLAETGQKMALQRGVGYSAFLIGTLDNYRLIWVENQDNTRI